MEKRIESIKNERVKEWKKLQTRKGRETSQTFMVEGFHLVEEAIKYKGTVETLVYVEGLQINKDWLGEVENSFEVTKEVMQAITKTETPQGIAAICKMPNHDLEIKRGQTYLLLDRLQDPGNLGTIIRTAEAAGISAVILTKGTVDPFNEKVLRSTQGAVFHFPVVVADEQEILIRCRENGIPVYGTALQSAVSYKQMEPEETFMLIVGNEGTGVQSELLNQTDQNIYIPILGKSESLNVAVATGILVYYLKKS